MITCGKCPDLSHCAPALTVYNIGRAVEEAGGAVVAMTIPCPRQPATGPSGAIPARSSAVQGCDNVSPVSFHLPAPVTARDRAQMPIINAIEELANNGLSCRAIADQLSLEGFNVSYRTVARRLRRGKV
jgi:hypothetical protein